MPTASKRPKRREGTANTFGLPRGHTLRKALVAVFREQRKEALKAIRREKSFKDALEHDPLAGLNLPDFRLGSLKMGERMTPHLEVLWDQAGRKFNSRLGLDPDAWKVTDPHTQRMIETAALDFCQSTNDTTTLALHDALKRTREELIAGVVEAGESLVKLTKRVNTVFDQAEKWRARRIAASEASRAVHSAQEESAKQSGVVAGWEWLLSDDACPLCQTVGRRAKFVPLGQPFAVVGDNPTYSTVRQPPLHPLCECTASEVLKPEYGGPADVPWAPTLDRPEPEAEDYPDGKPPGSKPEPPRLPPKPPGDFTPTHFGFGQGDEADAWGREQYRAWGESLTKPERDALWDYQLSGHEDLNRALRDGKPLSEAETKLLAGLDSALGKTEAPTDLVAYRGLIDPSKIFGKPPEKAVGTTFEDRGFVSTTLDPNMTRDFGAADDGAFLEVRIPQGSPAAYLNANPGGAAGQDIERELLLGRGLTFRVVGFEVRRMTFTWPGGFTQERDVPVFPVEVVAAGTKSLRLKRTKPSLSRFGWHPGEIIVHG